MEPKKYISNESGNIPEILQVGGMSRNASDKPFFVDNILPVESVIPLVPINFTELPLCMGTRFSIKK